MEKKRPVGVTLLGVIYVIFAIPTLLLAFVGAISGTGVSSLLETLLILIVKIIIILIPIFLLISAIGLLNLDNRARICAIIIGVIMSLGMSVYAIMGLQNILRGVTLSYSVPFSLLCFISVLLFLFSIYYLTRSKVKEQFK